MHGFTGEVATTVSAMVRDDVVRLIIAQVEAAYYSKVAIGTLTNNNCYRREVCVVSVVVVRIDNALNLLCSSERLHSSES